MALGDDTLEATNLQNARPAGHAPAQGTASKGRIRPSAVNSALTSLLFCSDPTSFYHILQYVSGFCATETCFLLLKTLYIFRHTGKIIGDAMPADPELLTTAEAAVVADVSVRDVNHLIDEHILPEQLYSTEGSRRVHASACSLLNFY